MLPLGAIKEEKGNLVVYTVQEPQGFEELNFLSYSGEGKQSMGIILKTLGFYL